MYPQGKARELFEAISQINKKAYARDVWLANHVLSKTPHCAEILEHYEQGLEPRKFSKLQIACKVLHCWATHLAVFGLMLLAKFAQNLSGLPNAKELKFCREPVTLVDIFVLAQCVLDQKKFTDPYFPGLYEALAQKGQSVFILARFYGTRSPRSLKKVFDILKKHNLPVITEYELLTFSDWLELLKFAFAFPLQTLELERNLEKEARLERAAPSTAEKFPAEAVEHVRAALLTCLAQNYMSGESRRLAAKRLAALLPENSKIISWYENQVIDKCFYRGLHEAGASAKTYAAQLLTWPDTLLNNHADPSDALHRAAPDVVLVNGSYFLPSLPPDAPGAASQPTEAPGSKPYRPYPNGPEYRIGPALRYRDLFDGLIKPDPTKPVLLLLSYHPEESERILSLGKKLADKGVPLAIKFHPATKEQTYGDLLNFAYTKISGPLKTALQETSLVMGSGSGSLAEAVALGVPVIAVQNIAGITFNYLPEYGRGELWESAGSAEEFFTAREKLMQTLTGDAYSREERVYTFRSLMFTEPTQEKIFQAFDLES